MPVKLAWLAAALLGVAVSASAEPTRLQLDPNASWEHRWTKLQMPPRLDGLTRTWIADFGTGQLDMIGTYQDPATRTTASLYLFRAGLADVSVWEDRIAQTIRANTQLGTADQAHALVGPFTPTGHAADSGYVVVYPESGQTFTASGFSLFPHDGWLVAVRMTSGTLTPEALRARLASFTAAILLAAGKFTYPRAEAMADCPEALSFGPPAPRATRDRASLLLLGAVATNARRPTDDKGKPTTTAPAREFCRDRLSAPMFNVYRAHGVRDSYVIAAADSGVAINVGRLDMTALPGGKANYWATLATAADIRFFGPFETLPTPQQVIQAVSSEPPAGSVVDPPEGKPTINLPSGSRQRRAAEPDR
jgi:hypothetical protein